MQSESKIESSEYADLSRVIRWFVRLRWIAIAGVIAALFIGRFLVHYDLPYGALFIIAGLLLAANIVYSVISSRTNMAIASRKRIALQFHFQICADYLFLVLLIYLTGFLQNPFVYFFVFHIMLTSFIFPKRTVLVYQFALTALLLMVAAGEYFSILNHFHLGAMGGSDVDGYLSRIPLRAAALIFTIGITAYLIVSIKERLEERGHRVELELDRYKSLDRAKSQFILQVTHELRGPVAAVKGYHEMIIKGITGEISGRTKETVTKANRRTQNLLIIIDEMLDFAYMKSEDDVKHTLGEINVRSIIQYNVDLHIPAARQKGIDLRGAAPKDLTIISSRDLLNIILGNLITNGIKYTGSGGSLSVLAEEEGNEVHIRVIDTGMGIRADEIEKIFEEFYRTRRAREVENDGTGLGLSIVQKAVNLLQGRISVYSEEGSGTRFHIYLPLRKEEEQENKELSNVEGQSADN